MAGESGSSLCYSADLKPGLSAERRRLEGQREDRGRTGTKEAQRGGGAGGAGGGRGAGGGGRAGGKERETPSTFLPMRLSGRIHT